MQTCFAVIACDLGTLCLQNKVVHSTAWCDSGGSEIRGNSVSPTSKGKRRPQELQPAAQNSSGSSVVPEAEVEAGQAIFSLI